MAGDIGKGLAAGHVTGITGSPAQETLASLVIRKHVRDQCYEGDFISMHNLIFVKVTHFISCYNFNFSRLLK